MRYDIADGQCLGLLYLVKGNVQPISTHEGSAGRALDDAATAAKSDKVSGALNNAKNRMAQDLSNLKNFYQGAVAGGVLAVTYYQTGDQTMAQEAANASVRADLDQARGSRRMVGGPTAV